MDPSQNSEKDKELTTSGSLEKNEDSPSSSPVAAPNTSDARTIDATGGQQSQSAPASSGEKLSFFTRISQKLNIYLLLLILLVLVAAAVSLFFFVKNKQIANKDTIDSQTLTPDALKQLANVDVTVGNTKQVLKVESNAIFAGSVLVRSDLEVAGSVKIGNELQLPGITVSGASRLNQLQADTLTVAASATIQGPLVAKSGIAASGDSTFDGALSATQITTNALQLSGPLTLTNHIVAGGPVPGLTRGNALGSGGTASVGGSDSAGTITINTGSSPGAGCFATITFVRKFDGVPHVSVTPIGSGAAGLAFYVNRSSSEFSVCTTTGAPAGQTFGFDYIIMN